MKLYFNKKHDEGFWCRPLTEWIKIAKEEGLTEIELIEAEKIKIDDMFMCKIFGAAFDNKQTCGKQCNDYSPRNGKSGCCRHYSTTFYEMSDKKTTIKIK